MYNETNDTYCTNCGGLYGAANRCLNCGKLKDNGNYLIEAPQNIYNSISYTTPVSNPSFNYQYSAVDNSNVFKKISIICIALSVILALVTCFSFANTSALKAENGKLNKTIEENLVTLNDNKATIASLNKQIEDNESSIATLKKVIEDDQKTISSLKHANVSQKGNLDFYQEHMAFVTSTDKFFYHTIDCVFMKGATYSSFNVNLAKSLGYSPCVACH